MPRPTTPLKQLLWASIFFAILCSGALHTSAPGHLEVINWPRDIVTVEVTQAVSTTLELEFSILTYPFREEPWLLPQVTGNTV